MQFEKKLWASTWSIGNLPEFWDESQYQTTDNNFQVISIFRVAKQLNLGLETKWIIQWCVKTRKNLNLWLLCGGLTKMKLVWTFFIL